MSAVDVHHVVTGPPGRARRRAVQLARLDHARCGTPRSTPSPSTSASCATTPAVTAARPSRAGRTPSTTSPTTSSPSSTPSASPSAHFVGLSLGGMTGMRLAARNPERVDRLVLLCTGAQLEPAGAWHDRAATVRAQGSGAVAEAVVGRWFTPGVPGDAPRRPARRIRGQWSRHPGRGLRLAAARRSQRWTCAPTCRASPRRRWRSPVPTTRPLRPPLLEDHRASSVQDGRLLVVPESAHLANAEQPADDHPGDHRPPDRSHHMSLDKVVASAGGRRGRHRAGLEPGRRRLRPRRHPVVPDRGAARTGRRRPRPSCRTTAVSTAPASACSSRHAGSAV